MQRECTRCRRPFAAADLSREETGNLEAERTAAGLDGIKFVYFHCPVCEMNDIFVAVLPLDTELAEDYEARRDAMEAVVRGLHAPDVEAVVVPVNAAVGATARPTVTRAPAAALPRFVLMGPHREILMANWLDRLTAAPACARGPQPPAFVARPPATPEQLLDLERQLGPLPPDLRSFLQTADGVTDEYGFPVVWGVQEIAAHNLPLRAGGDGRGSPVPYDHFLFFAGNGLGDHFGYYLRPLPPEVVSAMAGWSRSSVAHVLTTVTLYLNYHDGPSASGTVRFPAPTDNFADILDAAKAGLKASWRQGRCATHMHLIASELVRPAGWFRTLFDAPDPKAEAVARVKREINEKFGRFKIRSGATLFANAFYDDPANNHDVCDVRGKFCF